MRDLRLQDVSAFLAVLRNDSVSGAARELGVSVSFVSKAVDRLSRGLAVPLLAQHGRGVAVTAEGRRLQARLEDLLKGFDAVTADERGPRQAVTIAGPSYLLAHLLPFVARQHPSWHMAGVELAPAALRAHATDRAFDAAITVGDARLPGWRSYPLGSMPKALFATPQVAASLGPAPVPLEAVRALTYVLPVLFSGGQTVASDDGCPLPPHQRQIGHRATTVRIGLELAAASDQVLFAPEWAAAVFVRTGQLQRIEVHGWNVADPLFLLCHQDRVLRRTRDGLLDALRGGISAPGR